MANRSFIFSAGDVTTVADVENATPIRVGTIQSFDVSFDGDTAELFGNMSFAASTARTTISVTGTITMGEFQPEFSAEYFFGSTAIEGYHKSTSFNVLLDDTATYTVTDFNSNLGVYTTAGVALKRVGSNPNVNEYTLNDSTGTYTFNASLDGETVVVRADQFITTSGKTFELENQLMGSTPYFRIQAVGEFNKRVTGLILYHCMATSFAFSRSNTDYGQPTLDFSASVDDNDKLGRMFYN